MDRGQNPRGRVGVVDSNRVITTSHVNALAMVIARLEHLHAVNSALPGRMSARRDETGREEMKRDETGLRRLLPIRATRSQTVEGRETTRLVLPSFYFGSDA